MVFLWYEFVIIAPLSNVLIKTPSEICLLQDGLNGFKPLMAELANPACKSLELKLDG